MIRGMSGSDIMCCGNPKFLHGCTYSLSTYIEDVFFNTQEQGQSLYNDQMAGRFEIGMTNTQDIEIIMHNTKKA